MTTPPAPEQPSPAPADPARVIGRWSFVIPALGLALLVGLSVLPPSSTRIHAWPWALYATAGWLLPIVVAVSRLALGRPCARFGGTIDAGFVLLALFAVASAFISPLRGVVVPHLLPFLGTCALPYALLPLFHPASSRRTRNVGGCFLALIALVSLLLWLQPWNGFPGLGSRNAQPFGHANITGSVAVLTAFWFAFGAIHETGRRRAAFLLGIVIAVTTALSSGSRGAVLALAAAGVTAASITWLRRGRLFPFLLIILVLGSAALMSNARLRDLVIHQRWSAAASESNDQRTAMIVGGLRLGVERPLLGWGPGSVPHVFPRVRADLPGTADNFLQLHNTPVQLWATLGVAGLLASALIATGLLARVRTEPWTPPRIVLASAFAGTAVQLLFDHPFSTPVIAVLATALLTAWTKPKCNLIGYTSPAVPRLIALFGALALTPILFFTARDLLARRAYAGALDQASVDRPDGYVAGLHRARALAPEDPFYAHQLASYFATGSPFPRLSAPDPAGAIPLLQSTLATNPDLEYAHYNLGWLLLNRDPARAAAHFLAAARLAPQRGRVYLGLGLARIQTGDTDGAVRAFATEWLLDPSVAWAPIWRNNATLAPLLPRIRTLASSSAASLGRADPWAAFDAPTEAGASYRRVRTGYGVLMGHPDGPPPVDFNVQNKAVPPESVRSTLPAFGWLPGRTLLDFLHPPAP